MACHGLLHLFADPDQVLRVLRSQLAPGGSLYATSLVAETRIGTGSASLRRHDDKKTCQRSPTPRSVTRSNFDAKAPWFFSARTDPPCNPVKALVTRTTRALVFRSSIATGPRLH